MKPTLVIVGRPNVGKSTLFNRLTRTRDALVADVPGLTRDRHYGAGRMGDRAYLVVDTGGLEPEGQGVFVEMAKQARTAIAEADAVLLVTDAREGLTAQDRAIGEELRRMGRRVFVAVNKAEGMNPDLAAAEFHELGLGAPRAISAEHGQGVRDLVDAALADFPVEEEPDGESDKAARIAVVGRPNAGKSTLVNALVGEERVVTFDEPGTTRDAIDVELAIGGRRYILVDTAGLRRRGKVFESVEKFSVVKTLQAIDRANVAVLVLDAQGQISDQDAHIAGFILERGRALVVAVNKWDDLDDYARDMTKRAIALRLKFLSFARFHYISAREGRGVAQLIESVDRAYRAAMAKLPTPKLTRALMAAVAKQAPPRAGLSRPKLRYAHQGGSNPPIVVVHGTALNAVPDSYRRYLEADFRKLFRLEGTPLRIEFRSGRNPYVGKRL
ncbi:MAG: ribosome biogenesis GTPase Der [Bacillati bacterium ANGP1]|uniref:GTPase Der n=1 Tax=Candidatus Segetimicrobium genomatis TaxID=2569760 RepID=A0A537IIA9_9BACT|nr:MAG: ribosome biogenesis GTPase Der [Terrabacteria group bacterium ANGP1]